MATVDSVDVELTGDATGLVQATTVGKNSLARLTRELGVSVNGLSASTAQQRAFANHVRNTSYQINDFAVQVASGTSATVALSQQLPQVIQGFGMFGAVASAVAAVAIPTLAIALGNTGSAAKTFTEALDLMTEAIDDAAAAADDLSRDSLEELQRKYGNVTDELIRFLNVQRELRAERAVEVAIAAINTQAKELRGLMKPVYSSLLDMFGGSRVEARALADEFFAIRDAANPQEMLEKYDAFINTLIALREQNGLNNKEAKDFLDNMIAARNALANSIALLERPIELPAAAEIKEEDDDKPRRGYVRRTPEEINAEELERLQQQLLTEEQLEIESWNRRKQILYDALQYKQVTQEEFNALMEGANAQHQDKMVQLESRAQQQMLGNYSSLFGNMAAIAQAGGKKTTGIVKLLSVAQGLINSYLAYTQVLADPTLMGMPFLRQALAATTLAAGLAQVANMRSINYGSTGGPSGGASTGAMPSTPASPAAPAATPTNVAIQLTGGDMFSRDQVIMLINNINEAVEDGARIRVV